MLAYGSEITVTAAGVQSDAATHRASMGGDDLFDALNPKGRRRTASQASVRPEDKLLTQSRRDRLDANALDVQRNMSLLSWMIRRTLDYCCLWDYQPQTEDDGLNRDLRALMARDMEAEQNDYVGRMSWDDHRRVAEALKILTGDCHFMTLADGTLQLLEGSHCRNPRDKTDGSWVNGAKINSRGRILQWNFKDYDMTEGGSQYTDRKVSARRVWQHVQYENRPNQIRGSSAIAAQLNELRDIYETLDLTRAKVKLEQLFGIAIFREKDDEDELAPTTSSDGTDAGEDAESESSEEYYDFGAGPVVMNRTVGEDVKMLTCGSPPGNTQDFIRLCIQLALLGLDLPVNFWNPSETNFFGSRAAWNLYERACHGRRSCQLRLHMRYSRWRQWRWVLPTDFGGTGEIVLPRNMTPDDIRHTWKPRGVPWWKPQEELDAALASAAAGLTTMQGICDDTGRGLWIENLKQLARERDEAKALGFDLQFNPARLDVTLAGKLINAKGGAA